MKKQDERSIKEIMNQMADRMDALLDERERARKTRETGDIPDELRFWIAVDPLLSDLHKQFVDARAHHQRLMRSRGSGDPMTDVANDMADSAQCAFETRLIELRKDEDSKAMVLALMRRAHAMREEELNAKERARSNHFWREFARSKHRRPAPQPVLSNHFVMMISLYILRQSLENIRDDMSIASVFGRATGNENDSGWPRRLAGVSG